MTDPEFLDEEEAARLWQRVAQRQAEAARKAEAGSEEPAVEERDEEPSERFAVAHVRSAALEAGIPEEFLDGALADLQVERALPQSKRSVTWARRFFGGLTDTVTARRVVHAAAPGVLSAIEAIFPHEPYRLTLTDQQGDPLAGGVVVFDIQGLGLAPNGLAAEVQLSAVRQVFLSVRPIEGDTPSCEVTLRGPIAWSHNIGLAQGAIVTGVGAGLGGLTLGGGTLAAVGGLISSGFVVLGLTGVLGAVGVIAGGALGRKGFRALCTYGIRQAQRALEGLLGAVAARAEGGWGIALPEGDTQPRGLASGEGRSGDEARP
jgi:hypothetical protein